LKSLNQNKNEAAFRAARSEMITEIIKRHGVPKQVPGHPPEAQKGIDEFFKKQIRQEKKRNEKAI
jgi:hypothetical protein